VVDWHLDIRLALVAEPAPPVISPESPDVAWFDVGHPPGSLADGVDAQVTRTVQAPRSADAQFPGRL
jgi:hypothetical protein